MCVLYSLRFNSNGIVKACFDNADSIIAGKISYLRDKLNVNSYEVELQDSLKKIDVLFKCSHRISIHISKPKNL